MDSRAFLGLERASDHSFSLQVVPRLTTSGGFLFGGAGLGAGIAALETVTSRRCTWATAQYLSYARRDERVDVEVIVAVEGSSVTQARATCRVGDREILTVNAALGDRDFDASGQFVQMPEIIAPEDARPRTLRAAHANSIMEALDMRYVKGRDLEELDGTPSDGRTLMWVRIKSLVDGVDAAALGIMGDFVPMAVGQALGLRAGGNSLDNTIRFATLVPTDWVLLDIQVESVQRGFGHGTIQMFAQNGALLATASQSCIARKWKN
ncbi:MAG: acyl-CoA thioesterase [Ilumatobacteraceae bacterium]